MFLIRPGHLKVEQVELMSLRSHEQLPDIKLLHLQSDVGAVSVKILTFAESALLWNLSTGCITVGCSRNVNY